MHYSIQASCTTHPPSRPPHFSTSRAVSSNYSATSNKECVRKAISHSLKSNSLMSFLYRRKNTEGKKKEGTLASTLAPTRSRTQSLLPVYIKKKKSPNTSSKKEKEKAPFVLGPHKINYSEQNKNKTKPPPKNTGKTLVYSVIFRNPASSFYSYVRV